MFSSRTLGLALLAAIVAAALPSRSRWAASALLATASAAVCAEALRRYLGTWPMPPMHQAPLLSACALALILLAPAWNRSKLQAPPGASSLLARRLALGGLGLCLTAILLFPKDFYVPFLRSESPFAHAMLFFGALGRACLAVTVAWSLAFFPAKTGEHGPCQRRSLLWAAWGFVFWTLSLFSGEVWAYLGWGAPVVWHDPAVLLMMAAWFLYIGILHLHFFRISRGLRAAGVALGGVLALVCSLLADFGPFRLPW